MCLSCPENNRQRLCLRSGGLTRPEKSLHFLVKSPDSNLHFLVSPEIASSGKTNVKRFQD